MNLRLALAPVLLALGIGFAPAPLHAAEPVAGRWLTAEKDAVILIAPCGGSGSKGALCGTVERFLVAPPQGNDQRDVNNPDPAKRKRRLLGTTPILSAFREEADLWRGQIYDPKTGKTYRSVIRRKGPGVLEVKGCIGPFCQTQLWKKAS
jgi:uncharacterized protein (DUF2147 family)